MKNVLKNKTTYIMLTASILLTIGVAGAWINGVGSPSTDPNHPVIGTHDRILNSAIDMLPANYSNKINKTVADYGTEMPDYNNTMCNCTIGIRDQRYHQIYYHSDGTLQDDSSARRAQEEYNLAMANLSVGDKYNFSLHVGMMSHYIADIANFAHTMGNGSDWGGEGLPVHGEYENLVANSSTKFISPTYIKFDGNYGNITAYNATLDLGNDSTFDNKFGNGTYTNVWMYNSVNDTMNNNSGNLTYTNADPMLINRARQSLNYSVNLIVDVLYEMTSTNVTVAPNVTTTHTPSPTATPAPVPNSGSSSGGSSGSSSGSSGGGGGGLGTAEPYTNLYKYEVQERNVFTTPVSFRYVVPELAVYEVMVTSNQSNIASLRIEILRNTSKLVSKPAPGIVYKNLNAWIDYKRIKNATIRFKVENSWIDSNGLLADNVKMSKWDNSSNEWIELLTSVLNKDGNYTYIESQVNSLSGSFAINGIKEEKTQGDVQSQAEPQTNSVQTPVEGVEQTEIIPVNTDDQKAPGFEMVLSIVSILSIAYMSRRIRR